MVADIQTFAVSVPAGTLSSAPQVTDLAMPARIVRTVRVRVPPGPRGTVGWALAMAGTEIIPSNAGGWIVGDDEVIDWNLEGQPDSGAWQLSAYNIGAVAHTIYVTFGLDMPGRGAPAPAMPLVITAPAEGTIG